MSLVHRCLLLGADAYIRKPLSSERMNQLWQTWLVKHRDRVPPDSIPSSPLPTGAVRAARGHRQGSTGTTSPGSTMTSPSASPGSSSAAASFESMTIKDDAAADCRQQ